MSNYLKSPRVNSARLPDYVGKMVRLTGKVLRFDDAQDEVVVEASDRGEVHVTSLASAGANIRTDYIEVIGKVSGNATIKARSCMNLGAQLDMSLVEFVVEKWHDPRFSSLF